MMDAKKIIVADNAPYYYPIEILEGWIDYGNNTRIHLPKKFPIQGEWGHPIGAEAHFCNPQEIIEINVEYLSIVESKTYSIRESFYFSNNTGHVDNDERDTFFIVGIAPYGEISIWQYSRDKSIVIKWFNATLSNHETTYDWNVSTINKICTKYIDEDTIVKNNYMNIGLPPRDLYDRYMQQFSYCYVVEFGHWDEEKKEWKDYEGDEVRPEFEYIEESLYDGTHDKLHDGGLMQYHPAGKPKKLALQYHIKKSVYSAYLWFDDFKIRAAFENFYCEYPEAEMDFLFRIDPEKNIYRILFTCKEAEQPVPLNEDAYQMIVFKSKFERYRTKNYNQPRGAWIW